MKGYFDSRHRNIIQTKMFHVRSFIIIYVSIKLPVDKRKYVSGEIQPGRTHRADKLALTVALHALAH